MDTYITQNWERMKFMVLVMTVFGVLVVLLGIFYIVGMKGIYCKFMGILCIMSGILLVFSI